MSQMLQLIKSNSVPAAVMRSAAKGALSVPTVEMLQILVHLTSNPVFTQEAALTLAKWDQASATAVLSSPDAPREVIEYFLDRRNRRPALMQALVENPLLPEQSLVELAAGASRELVDLLLASPRVRSAPNVIKALAKNPHLTPTEHQQLGVGISPKNSESADPESEAAHTAWTQEHAAEIAAEEGTAFELMGVAEESQEPPVSTSPAPAVETAAGKPGNPSLSEPVRVSTLVRLSRMTVSERVKQGFIGTKEERAILIRDTAKVVQNAVLASPKVGEAEVETFASAKNVTENVLREIARNRRYMKIYSVVRNLTGNPRCPLDISLTLVKNLLVTDLKNLQGNKNVPDTLRKVATKLYKEKKAPAGQKVEY
jgi:hypothetical protein